ncbi:MAG: methionine adenosyltransferase [Actinomycetota bacterium]
MYPKNMVFTSESVTEGHPDKFCDQVSDAVLDECLRVDPASHVACNTCITVGLIVVGGEVTSRAHFNVDELVRGIGTEIGYTSPACGFDVNTSTVMKAIHPQSPDINQGVSQPGGRLGAGDQGLMFGFACRQTEELMPLPILLAHRMAMRLAEVRKTRLLPYLGPDGKTQITVEYREGKPSRVDHVVIAAQHTDAVLTPDGSMMNNDARQEIIANVALPVVENLVDEKTKFTINGTGKFLVGGPQADSGMTGRKNIVDTYGGWAMHGGGALSGKDPTKVDRSAGYMTRYIAKNIVAAGLADECLVQVGYCIGLPDPVSVMVNTFSTGKLSDESLCTLVRGVFPLSPKGMIEHLDLLRPIYRKLAAYGHFGRSDVEFTWERTDAIDELLAKAGKIAA